MKQTQIEAKSKEIKKINVSKRWARCNIFKRLIKCLKKKKIILMHFGGLTQFPLTHELKFLIKCK